MKLFDNDRGILRLDYLLLLPVLGLAFYIAFIPHQNYPYPLHVDEWVHLARSSAIIEEGSITIIDPFFGQSVVSLSSNLEASFQMFWGVFQQLSGLSWMSIFRYFPGIIFMITVLSVYILARREGFGLEAAFFACLIPTTVGILGPAFLVPVSMGLLFTPLILFVAFNFRTIRSYLVLFILISFLLAIHAPSAISPIIVLTPYILLNLKGNFKHSLGLALALSLPFLVTFPWIFELLLPTARSLFNAQPHTEFVQLPQLFIVYGYLPIAFCLLGAFYLAMRGKRADYGLILGLLALLLMLVTFFTFNYGVSIMYERGLMYMLLIASIIAGAGLTGIRHLKLPERLSAWLKSPSITRYLNQYLGGLLSLALIIIILLAVIPGRLATPYYYMIDKEDFQTFVWINENIEDNGKIALLDPWKATAFTALTGKHIYTRIHMAPFAKDKEAYSFIRDGSSDSGFLRENEITLIYTRVYEGMKGNVVYSSNNPDLIEVAPNVYRLK
ncbi:MAG: hypothetical protein Q8Q07_07645 [Dehalococcoidales bacterium]|nr:hypothetical protein [Dehalococcoidales bacterium]